MLKEKFPKVDVVNDPDGFNLVDKNTLVFSIGGFEGFWYQMAMGTAVTKPVSPAVIVSDTFNWNSWKHLKKPDAAMPTKFVLPYILFEIQANEVLKGFFISRND